MKQHPAAAAASYALLAVLAFVMLFPLLYAISGSLMTAREISTYPPAFLPSQPRLNNFADVLNALPIPRQYLNSLIVAACVMVGQLATSILSAYAFAFLRMPLRRLRCPDHGVVTEAVPFAAAHSGYTYAFEDLVAWLAQRADAHSGESEHSVRSFRTVSVGDRVAAEVRPRRVPCGHLPFTMVFGSLAPRATLRRSRRNGERHVPGVTAIAQRPS